VLDCFSSLAEIPLDSFQSWLESLPEGPGRTKLEGVIKWGEIEINRSHISILMPLLEEKMSGVRCQVSRDISAQSSVPNPGPPPDEQMPVGEMEWQSLLSLCMQGMLQEPALYLMLRKYT
jgi:hypothetical protein